MKRRFVTVTRGRMQSFPPVDDIEAVWSAAEREIVTGMLREPHVGPPRAVRDGLAARTQANDLILMAETRALEDRIRSYGLLAEAWCR